MEKGYFHEVRRLGADGQPVTSMVPVVQELARQGLKYLPERFIREEMEAPPFSSNVGEGEEGPPVINMQNLNHDAEAEHRAKELAKLAKVAKEWGVFFIKHNGIPLDLLNSLQDMVKGFFSLSFEDKKESVGTYASTDNLGYGRSFIKSDDQRLDWIDRLSMRAAPKNSTLGLHVWPTNPKDFRTVMEKYVEEARKICDELLQALAEALGLDTKSFLRYLEPSESIVNVRVNYYPPCPRPDLAMGLTSHSDGSVLTLLAQFGETDGLEVFKEATWVRLAFPPEALVVVVGDFLEIMSNGILQSPWHRAVTHKDKERFSTALFYNPPLQAEIEPVKELRTGEIRYKKVVMGDYLKHYYDVHPCKEKQAIRFAKV
ncbi:protein SRG1-like protein [Cinnamomum micranthum f. kanehirae]|uniref:Protein SRG1-like protein n=1 Tax=Cinnamomum micranthum f. kanehirae TaxID=337451 RepID=A0A443N5Y7_9MAGN|nr:protein SRG1-like protein [Cinnamomum micranthum f. kanehirae]